MKRFIISLVLLYSICLSAHSQAAGLADLKFGQAQIADSQWNVSSCMYTATCQIYSKNPGTAYKIPWTNGQLTWAAGSYVKFDANIVQTGSHCSFWNVFGICIGSQIPDYGRSTTNPWLAKQYNADGTLRATMGAGHIINMGNDFFFFVGSDNNTGQLFSMTSGMSGSAGLTWTGTLNPSISQVDTLAATNGSTTPLAAGQTAAPPPPAAPSLCCGGSAAAFNASQTNSAKVMAFTSRTTADSKVNIEQIGNFNVTTIDQSGTKNNYTNYYVNGSNNTTNIKQSGNASTQVNYVDLAITGNSNTSNITQTSTGGGKGAFITVANDGNNVKLQQKDSGSHYAEINLTGGNKSVDITQQGAGNHMTSVTLSGMPTSLTLTQSGGTQQFYSITHNCATSGGCGAITVTQGQ